MDQGHGAVGGGPGIPHTLHHLCKKDYLDSRGGMAFVPGFWAAGVSCLRVFVYSARARSSAGTAGQGLLAVWDLLSLWRGWRLGQSRRWPSVSMSPNPKNSEASLVGSTLCPLSHIRGRAVMPSVTLQKAPFFTFPRFCPHAIPCLISFVVFPITHCSQVYIRFQGKFEES